MENTITMRRAVWNKAIAYVDGHTVKQIALHVLLFFVAGVVSAAAFDAPAVFNALTEWKGGAVPASFLTFAVFLHLPNLYIIARDAFQLSREKARAMPEPDGTSVEALPMQELLDHLFTYKTFKRDDIESRFMLPRYRYTALVKRMKKAGILTHGVNNQTVLNEEWSRARVAAALMDSEEGDIKDPVNIVRPLPSSAPRFIRRVLQETASASRVQPLCNQYATA